MEFLYNMSPDEADILEIRTKLQAYNRDFFEIHSRQTFIIKLTTKSGDVSAGIVCKITGNWLEIKFLWVASQSRGNNIGTRLLQEAERFGKQKGCLTAALNTYNFQAKPFYEKNGYKIVYIQYNYPKTSTRYFMEKQLS